VLALKTPLAEFAGPLQFVAQMPTSNKPASAASPSRSGRHGHRNRSKLCTSSSQHHVEIETVSDLTRGKTVVDRLNVIGRYPKPSILVPIHARQPNKIHICWTLDIPAWKAALYSSLAS
jgi:hypothetical protein